MDEVCQTLDRFSESAEVHNLIDALPAACGDIIAQESLCEKFTVILDRYQEQPHLLDPHLEGLVNRLLGMGRDTNAPPALVHQAFKYLYIVTKVRGYKYISRLFPHQVTDLEPVLSLLQKQDPTDCETWETRYVLLLWLSLLAMVPFDMARFDGSGTGDVSERRVSVVDRILELAKRYVKVSDKPRDAAALLLAKFMTRPDMTRQKLPEVLDWLLQLLLSSNREAMSGISAVHGALSTMSSLFKHGRREDLLGHAPSVLKCLSSSDTFLSSNTLLRKLAIKLVQRLGLVFLRAKVPAWRYQRGQRSLAENLAPALIEQLKVSSSGHVQKVLDDDEYNIPQEIEDVIERLLFGLKDPDTIVRWSAAKGIGRVTGRLPKDLADEVLTSVLDCFSLQEVEGSWHGGCLALAELGRRGLLLPHRLDEVVPVVLRALAYDERRGSYSIGAPVRDAACYVCWAFARAYNPKEIKPYVNQIASSMIITALFDREVNCRKAASAAFQENVGRQGTFPHGIDVLTAADYFTVGNRSTVYLTVSVYVAQFPEYTHAFIDHLVDVKLSHWDSAIRVLASQALHNLTVRDPDYMANVVIPKLVTRAVGIDRNARHGSLLAIGEVIHALSKHAASLDKHVQDVVSEDSLCLIKGIVSRMIETNLFRGTGGEMMRFAVCLYINKLSLSQVPFHDDPVIGVWQTVLDDNIPHVDHNDPWIQESAVSALKSFATEFYSSQDRVVSDGVVDQYLEKLRSSVDFDRMGFSLALGALPKFVLSGKLNKVINGMINTSKLSTNKEQDGQFAEARRDALKGLASVCSTVGLSATDPGCLQREDVVVIFEAMLAALEDYTMDSRGDSGAWVREASMSGIETLVQLTVLSVPEWFTADLCKQVMCCLVQQINEKIDRTRAHAGNVFLKLLYSTSPVIPHIPHRKELEALFPTCDQDTLNWAAPCDSFPKTVQLLSLPTYQYPALLGLLVSVGGLTESLVRHSSSSFLQYLKQASASDLEMRSFIDTLLKIFTEHQKDDRITIPLFGTVDLLLSSSALGALLTDSTESFPLRLFELCKEEIRGSGDAKKIIASINVFCELITFSGPVRRKAINQLLLLLGHKYPRVRTTTADQLYVTLLTFDDVVPDGCHDDIMTMLSETPWNSDVQTIRPIRNNICDVFGIARPKALKPTSTSKQSSQPSDSDELGYKDLVDRVGY